MNILKTHYWIPTTTWNLADVFATECISPNSFYSNRLFGSRSNKTADDNGKVIGGENSIILYPRNFTFTPSIGKPAFILISSNALDKKFLEIDENEIAYYRKSIYLKRGNFQVRFFTEEDKAIFIATLSINLETKTLKKYDVEFDFSASRQEILHTKMPLGTYNFNPVEIPLDTRIDDQLYFDKAFNHIKGFMYGIVCSNFGKKTSNQIKLERKLIDIKSKISGFRTRLELTEEYYPEMVSAIVEEVNDIELAYSNIFPDQTSTIFKNISHRLKEIGNLQALRLSTLAIQKQKFAQIDKYLIQTIRDRLQDLQSKDFDLKTKQENIFKEIKTLDFEQKNIKRQTRNSPAFEKKIFLKSTIEELKNNIEIIKAERRPIKNEIQKSKAELSEYSEYGRTQFDSNIEEQFYKISGYLNDLIFSTNDKITQSQQAQNTNPDIQGIRFAINSLKSSLIEGINQGFIISLHSEMLNFDSDEEEFLFKVIIEVIFLESGTSSEVSEINITRITEKVLSLFSESKLSETMTGREIISHLKNLYEYRVNREMNFTIPESYPVLQNFISFVIKPYNNEELKNFVYSRNVIDNHLSFSMWASFVGFANLPKTFTDILLNSENDLVIDYVDSYLFNYYLF